MEKIKPCFIDRSDCLKTFNNFVVLLFFMYACFTKFKCTRGLTNLYYSVNVQCVKHCIP